MKLRLLGLTVLLVLCSGCATIWDYFKPKPDPVPVAGERWRGCLFTPAHAYENSHGAASQMGFRSSHGAANENPWRVAMAQGVADLGGDTLTEILGTSWQDAPVLDMCLNGRKHPGDGHYFPIANPLQSSSEVDWALWMARDLGIKHRLTWIWNDDNSMQFTLATVQKAVAHFDGTRLGMTNVAFGVCLETDEIMSADLAAQALSWIKQTAPHSRAVVGSSNADYLIAVWKKAGSAAYYWLEAATVASGNPITDPLTLANYKAKLLDKAAKLKAAGIPAAHIICGEWWSPDAAVRKEITKQIEASGYEAGSGQWLATVSARNPPPPPDPLAPVEHFARHFEWLWKWMER